MALEGKDGVQEFLKSDCTYTRFLECCVKSDEGKYILNDLAIQSIENSDRLVLRSNLMDVCSPLVFFMNS